MPVNPYIFRAYDIRGVYPTELNEEAAYLIARSYAQLFPEARNIVVSQDFRTSSPSLAEALTRGLVESGKMTVVDIGAGPVPVFYFAIVRGEYDGGLMVTGSHNPVQYNGIKIQKEGAIPVVGETGIYAMRDRIAISDFRFQISDLKNNGGVFHKRFTEEYIDYVAGKTKLSRPLKIVLDTGNGACGDIPERIFQKLGCEVKTLFKEPDGTFPNHLPDPHQKETLKFLREEVLKEGADCGIAFDGDGDRAGLVDEKGNVVGMDFVLMMLARQALERARNSAEKKGNKVVVDVRASKAFLEDIKARGGEPVMTRVGHSYLLNEVIAQKAAFGGEFTGHFYFPLEYFDYDDGIFASCKLAEIVSGVSSISAYVDSLPRYAASPEIFIESTDDEKFKKVEEVVSYVRKQGYTTIDLDGARIEFPRGWALVRASNTTPDIKLRFEGETKNDLQEIAAILVSIFQAVNLEIPSVME